MSPRKIIEIDRKKCNGCGLCTEACVEGALVLDEENKAVLVNEIFCDGLGACLDVCPTGALKIRERESKEYDPRAAYRHVLKTKGRAAAARVHRAEDVIPQKPPTSESCRRHSCPGSAARDIERKPSPPGLSAEEPASELTQWPIQLHLVSPLAPVFNNSDLLVAADCTAFSFGGFHSKILKGKKLIIACPKLDDTGNYVHKLTEILKNNTIRSLTVALMSVPCCTGLYRMVEEAAALSGKDIKIDKIIVDVNGDIREGMNRGYAV